MAGDIIGSPDTWDLKLPGTPPSFNQVGHTGNRWAWSKAKRQWDGFFTVALLEARVPKGVGFERKVRATATLYFKDSRRRDSVNYRTLLEKSLGDALQAGWIEDDTPDEFEFGAVRFEKVARGKPPITIVRLEVIDK
jgi:hypothetical protein